MKRNLVFVIMFLVFSLFGCSPTTSKVNTPTISLSPPTPNPTRTVTATQKPFTALTPFATPTPTLIATKSILPPTPTSVPLSQTGPWMLLSKGTMSTGPMPDIDPILINADGSAWERLNVPRPQWAKLDDPLWYYIDSAPKGPYLAVRGFMELYELHCNENAQPKNPDPYDDILYIFKLPENKPVHQIFLHGLKAKAEEQKENCHLNDGEIPPVIGVTSLQLNISWSPNGRYMAFSAAPDGPAADLYLFDLQADTIRRLTTRQNNPMIIGWSPDSQTIIYKGVTKMVTFRDQVYESSGLYAVSVSGTDRLLLKPNYVPGVVEWLSSSDFIFQDRLCDPFDFGTEACKIDLLTVDLSTGKYETIYKDVNDYVYYLTDPIHHLLLFLGPPSEMLGKVVRKETPTPNPYGGVRSSAEGIYQYNFQTHSLHPVLIGEKLDGSVYWDSKYQALRWDEYLLEPPYTRNSTLVYYEPGRGFRAEKLPASPYTSPDGEWQIGLVGQDPYIMDNSARPVQKMSSDRVWGFWSPDSSSYIQITETGFTVYLRKNNWQNPRTRYLTGFGWWGIWITL